MIKLIAFFVFAFTCQDDNMHALIREGQIASLSTDFKKTPFGSLVPYAIDTQGNPIVFLSDLAQHTENLKKNPKCSLMVHKIDKDDVFSSPRITFVGKLVKVPDKEREAAAKIYLKKNPQAEQIIDFGDFNFYRFEIRTIHYIGGFGDINWITPEEYRKSRLKIIF
jgi:heme iron utilization protein